MPIATDGYAVRHARLPKWLAKGLAIAAARDGISCQALMLRALYRELERQCPDVVPSAAAAEVNRLIDQWGARGSRRVPAAALLPPPTDRRSALRGS